MSDNPLMPGTLPPQVIQNYDNPQSRRPEILGIGIPFITIASIFFLLRVYVKTVMTKKWRLDDTVLSLGFVLSFLYVIVLGYGSTHSVYGKHLYEVQSADLQSPVAFWVCLWLGSILFVPAYGLLKTALFLQYYHLFKPERWMRIALAIGLTVNILLYTGLTIFLIASETPRPGEKSYLATAFSDHFQNARFSFSPTGYMSLIIDLYLLILPLPAIYKLKLTRAKKFGIFFIFMVGGLGCFASLASLYIRVRINDLFKDPMWNLVSITNFVVIELCCAVIACCAPSINLFWKQITEQRTSTSTSNSKRKTSMRTWLGRTINFSTFRNRNRCGKSGNSSNSDDSANWSSDPKKPVESIFITHDFVMSSSGGSLLAKNETYAPRGSPYTQDVEAQMSSPSSPAPSSTRDIRNEKAALGGSRSADLKW